MDAEAEAWWAIRYPQYSLRDPSQEPLFAELNAHSESWEDSETHTKGQISASIRTISRDFPQQKRTESLSCENKSWTRSSKEMKAAYTLVITACRKEEDEWGRVERQYDTHVQEEVWSVKGGNKVYERTRVEAGVRKGMRVGLTQIKDTTARWVEEMWEEEGEKVFKKAWERPGESGGESRMDKEDYTWGENWYSSGIRFESKIWHRQKTHLWGQEHGHELATTWTHDWDLDTANKREDKLTLKAGREYGYRYRQEGQDWHKEEWEGRRFPEDPAASQDSALLALYVREHKGSLKSLAVLDALLALRPEFNDEGSALRALVLKADEQPKTNTREILQRVNELRDLQDAAEELKERIIRQLSSRRPIGEGKLFEIVKAHKTEATAPLSGEELFVFFEDFLDAKYVDDNQNFDKGVSPPTVAVFLPPYLQQAVPQAEAFRRLAALLNGLKVLRSEDRYADLLCKLLGICGYEAAPYQLALFLVRVRKEFQRIAEKLQIVPTGNKRKAALLDVVHFVYDLFKNDPERGQELLQGLKPDTLDSDDYSAFLICARLNRLELTPANVFQYFGTAKVKEPVLIGSLKQRLELWLNEEEIAQVFNAVEDKGVITEEAFEERLAFHRLQELATAHAVTEADFLQALTHVYNTKTSKDSMHLSRTFDSYRGREMSQTRFAELLRTMDSELTDQQIQVVVRAALIHAGPEHIVSKEAFVEALLDYPVGDYRMSVFGNNYTVLPETRLSAWRSDIH